MDQRVSPKDQVVRYITSIQRVTLGLLEMFWDQVVLVYLVYTGTST